MRWAITGMPGPIRRMTSSAVLLVDSMVSTVTSAFSGDAARRGRCALEQRGGRNAVLRANDRIRAHASIYMA
jgi:hypothetical protein